MKTLSQSLEQTSELAQSFIAGIAPKQDSATVVGLFGDLGAGKTTFTKACAEALGISETVASPTFVIEKIYATPLRLRGTSKFDQLIHIDAYRLEGGEELIKLGWKEVIENPKNLVLIEWPEKVSEALPNDMMKLYFKFIDEKTREITI